MWHGRLGTATKKQAVRAEGGDGPEIEQTGDDLCGDFGPKSKEVDGTLLFVNEGALPERNEARGEEGSL